MKDPLPHTGALVLSPGYAPGRYWTMGRSLKPLELSTGRPVGKRWSAYAAGLRTTWYKTGRACFYCSHPFAAPHLIEVCHLVSPVIRPDLAWSRDNLVPGHGPNKRTGNKRCPEINCDLDCNWTAHNAPDSPKDKDGSDLPFGPEFLAKKQRERAQFLRNGNRPANPRPLVVPFRPVSPDARTDGRPW